MNEYISRVNEKKRKKEILILNDTTLVAILQLSQNEEGKIQNLGKTSVIIYIIFR